MGKQEVRVIIDPNGDVRLDVRGVKGRDCLEITEDVIDALGGEVAERKLTEEAEEEPEKLDLWGEDSTHDRTHDPTRVRR